MRRCAGICGVHPADFTVRELIAMAEARQTMEWDRTAALMLLVARVCGNKKVELADFHPYRKDEAPKRRGMSIATWLMFNAPAEILEQKRQAAEASAIDSAAAAAG